MKRRMAIIINQTESRLTFYPDADNYIEIRCPECASRKKIDASGYQGKYKIMNVKCLCGFSFKCSFEFRKSYRMKVNLAGEFTLLKTQKSGSILIENLSLAGANFVNMSGQHLLVGQKLELKFRLDDAGRTELRKKVTIKSIDGTNISSEFVQKNSYEKAMGFYLKHY